MVGETFEADIGAIAHGGHCVARIPLVQGEPPRVVFVRHALPGERALVTVTEGGSEDRFLRGDATTILTPSPDRVTAPCRYAGPEACGGCDFQHASLAAQRRLKGEVVEEQLRRLAGVERAVTVEAVPLDDEADDGLRWRTRVQWAYDRQGRRGLRSHRSHEVVAVDDCLLLAPGARDASSSGIVSEVVGSHRFEVNSDGFWQVHRRAPQVLVDAVLDFAAPRPGEGVVDLYAGVGLFSAFLAEVVGPAGRVVAVEGVGRATDHARANLAAYPWASVAAADVSRFAVPAADLVVLDPPRDGARRPVVESIVAAGPSRVVYVACDPAALARDVGTFAEHGYVLTDLRAFDLFPMTHHVECVALLTKTGFDLR
ncbi:MAG: class I SAM-dependent RNA methyltransferase [Nocardioidaceae bacterium]